MSKLRILSLVLAGAIALCLTVLRGGHTQSSVLSRVTNTTEEGINLNPSISGDGRILAFESTEDIAGAGGPDHFRAIRANVSADPATFFQMGGTRAVAPAISQDGSRIAFASKDDPLGTNLDGNSEIFLLDGSKLTQVTNTLPGDIANRVTNGSFQPSISDDGRFIAFSSNRDLAAQNSDGNLEIFICDALAASFTQLTNSSGIVGSSDAKISGNGAMVAYIRDTGVTLSAKRDLIEQPRFGLGPTLLLAANVQSLAMTYGRAISDDGTRVVYSAETATNTTQVFLFDGRGGATARQITALGARVTEVPLHPTISGDGTHIGFATRRSVPGAPTNSDGGVELYVLDIPTSQISKITNAPSSATADVVSSLNDDGSVVAFNFPRILSGALVNSDLANDSEIYLTGTPARPLSGTVSVLNGASVGKEPSSTKAVAPDSIAMATGGALANSTQQPQKLPNGTFPTNVGGTTVTVNGRAAQIFFVSPGQVNFLVPTQTEIGTANVVITNSENFTSRGTVPTLRAAPGVFTRSGDGSGPGVILNSDTLLEAPFDPTDGNLRLTIFTTGARNATQNLVSLGGRVVTPESVIASPNMPGLDEVHVLVPRDLRGAGTVDLFVQSDGRASNPVSVTFTGDSSRDILINEALADPPDGIAGDVNRDGLRDSGDDEFIELVNTTAHDIDISGYQLLSRSSSTTTDTLRHTFAPGTILPACTAAVVFGGGTFDPTNAAFGGALAVKATSGGLSLTNGGGAITLRASASAIITSFSWGGLTGLNGDANQSMTRAPDITGNFVLHLAASGNSGRSFSPGTRVSGAAFAQCNPFVRIDVTPTSATIDAGAKQQFTAKAINANGNEVSGVIFSWQSSNTSVATIDQNGLATSSTAGSTEIRASAHATQSAPATLTVREIQRVLTRVDVTPPSATIPATGAQQFTAHGIDQFGNEIAGLTFTWASTNTSAATVDQNGLATGIAQGQSSIKATSQNVTSAATLTVSAPTMVVNEVLADPATGTDGDANHDGTRDSADDEFVELVNSTGAAINISGWTVRTHSPTSATETIRHTFTAGTSVPTGEAMVVFGGGTFNPNDPLFGCARVAKASSGGLSLTNSGLTIMVQDGSGNLVTQFSYGGTTGLNGGNAQSLTRSPDITGNFVLHSTIAGGRKFSSGLKVDGTPFGNCPGHPASVTISPASTTITVGQTTQFTAQAFDQFGRAMVGVAITFASDNTGVATVDSVTANPSTGIATATVSAHNPGTAHITASGTDGTATANGPQATLTVNGPSLTINDVSLNEGDAGTTTFTFTVSLSTPAPADGVTFNIATQDGTATTANNDYVARSLTGQTIAAGQSTYTFDVTVNGDLTIEPSETFLVNVTNVAGASIGDGQGIGTIINDDSPSLSVSDVTANEGNTGTTTFSFTVSTPFAAMAGGITFDIATADGTAIAASGDYVARSLTGQTIPAGQSTYTFDVTVNGDTLGEPNETFTVNITNVSGATVTDASALGTIQNDDTATLVISQVYGGGDNSGAPFRNDFVEIYNRGTTTVDLSVTSYSVQYASVGSNFGASKTNLTTGLIAPGRYFLVQESGGTTTGVALPTPDATGTIALAATSGKVALVAGTNALAASTCPGDDNVAPFNPSNAAIADLVGYGNSATTAGHCYEGPGPASAPSSTTADFRKAGGCLDTNDNAADFFVASPNPRNSSAPFGDCKPDVTINDVTVTEGNTGTVSATFTVTLSTASASTVTVNFATADGTATAPADYQSNSGALTFNPGDLTKTITVLVNGDTLDEASETFFVNLTSATNGVLIDNQGHGTITDNDPTPSLSINDVSVAEGDSGTTAATFTVTLSTASGRTVTVNYTTADNTAEAATDYQATSGTLTFNPGDTSKTITVLVNGDTSFEQNETFFVNLTAPTNATISNIQGQATITNDDAAPPTPTFFITDVSVAEGNSGTSIATFNVTLSPSSSNPVTVDFATANGTATVTGNDYQSASGTLTFNAGDTSKPINVTTNGDLLVEPDETFTVNLTNATGGATIGTPHGTGTIQNDDAALVVISQIYGGGGNSGATYKNDFIELFNRGTTTVDLAGWSVQQSSASGTSWSVTPLCASASCLLTPGTYFLVQEFSGGPVGASLPGPDATGTSNLSVTSGKIALVKNTTAITDNGCPFGAGVVDFAGYGSSADCSEASTHAPAHSNTTADYRKSGGCIDTNDNAADFVVSGPNPRNSSSAINDCSTGFRPDISINDVTVTEGDTRTKTVDFTVTLSAANNAQTVTVNYATANGTATAGSDYQSASGTVSFAPGETSKPVTITIIGDTSDEPNETFVVNLSNAANGAILDAQGQGTITDDDVPPTLTINDVSLNEGDGGPTTFHFVVSLSAPALTGGVTFDIATQDGTATVSDNDYVARSLMSQTIPAGQQNFAFDVTVNGDVTIEGSEQFLVNVSNVSGATVGDAQGVGTIQNDDSPALNINDVSASEGNSGTTTFTFTVTSTLPAPTGGITFNIATSDGTATVAGNDYVARSLTNQTIPAGQSSYTFDVTANGDSLVESDEAFFVDVTPVSGASGGDTHGVGTIQNDDTAHLVISQVYGGGGNSTAVYQHDFVEIFNRGTTTVDFSLTPYSVQYAGTSSTFGSSKTDLTHGTMAPGQYFLIQESAGNSCSGLPCGSPLPPPDATGTINLAGTSGKVALVANTNALPGDTCPNASAGTPFNPNNSAIADFGGYGSTAGAPNCHEGTGPAPAPNGSNTNGVLRAAGGCTDTDQNASDFATGSLNPRTSATALHDCNAPPTLTSVTITPATAVIGVGDMQQFTGQALDQFGQPIAGVTLSFASNDTNIATVGSVSATLGSGAATGTVAGRASGSAEIRASATNGSTNVTSSPATITVEPAAGQILISEFRTRGPGGATDEFIEIYNPTTATVTIGGLVIRSSNNAGTLTTRATITAGTTLGPGCHYLFAPTTLTGVTADQTFTNGITDDGGVAITRSDLATIIDGAGMSSGSAYKEGKPLAPLTGTTNQSYERKPGGASGNGTDTNNNASDFVLNVNTSNPQNSSSSCLATNTADLSITKTDSPDPVTVGSNITYTLTVTNDGIGPAQTVVVTDTLPTSLTLVSCNSTGAGVCGGTGNNRTVTFSYLAVGSSATITLVATVNGTGGASISNTASVSSATTDSNSANDSATTTTTVSAADLSMSKLDSPDPVNAGENITYTLTVTNNSSTIPAQSVTVSDPIPANTTFVSVGSAPSGWTRTDTTTTGQTGTITYTRATLPASGTATFTVTVKVDSGAANNSIISNTANVASSTPDDNSANDAQTATTTVRTPSDLSLSKTVNNATPNVGENVTFTITVSNAGPYAATGVTIKDLLPPGLSYVSDDGAGSYAQGTGIWTVGTVAVSGTATLHITATAGAPTISGVTNTAEITAADQFDPDSTPNNHSSGEDDQSSVVVTARSADVSLSKTVDNSSPNVGQDVTFRITLSNGGPNAATNVLVKDLLPAALTFVSSTQSQGTYDSVSGIWTGGTVDASSSATLSIKATVQSSGTITNTAEVTACDVFDPDSTPNNHIAGEDDQASRIISSLRADLSLLKSVNNTTPNVGDNVVFTVTVSNAGPSTATGVLVKDQLPTGLTYVSDDGAGAYVTSSVAWTVGTVAASSTATLHITATATSASINGVTNTAEITASDVPDPDSTPNNHSASEDDQSSAVVNAKDADLSVSKTVDNATPNLNSNVTFTVRLSNAGSDAATGVVVSDSLPAGLTFVSATPTQGTYDNNTGVWTVGTVSVGSNTATLSITATVATSGAKTNTAEITASGVFDPDSTPNNHSAGEDDQSSVVITPQQVADLSLTKAVNNSTPNIGQNVTFTIKVSNAGPSVATGVQVKDLLPAGLQFVSSTPSQGSYVSGTGLWTVGTVSVGTDVATLIIRATVLTTGAKTNTAEVTASDLTDPDSTPNNNAAGEDDQARVTVTGAANLLINEIHTQAQASPPPDANDFVELFNKSTQSIDVSGLLISYRAGNTTANTFTLPASTVIPAGGYLIIVNGANAYGVAAGVNGSSAGFNLTATSGGVKIELNGVKLDGLAYQTPGSTVSATFAAFGEGTVFTSPVASGQQDYVRSPNGADSNDNATDFRRSGANSTTVTPKASNPTVLP